MKRAKNLIGVELRSFGVGLFFGCILVSLAYTAMNNSDVISFAALSSQPLSSPLSRAASTGPAGESFASIPASEGYRNVTQKRAQGYEDADKGPDSSGKSEAVVMFPSNSSNAASDKQRPPNNVEQAAVTDHDVQPEKSAMRDLSSPRSDVCDIEGDVRIVGKDLSSVLLVDPALAGNTNKSWSIRPYARKWDKWGTSNVRQVNVTSVRSYEEAPRCTINHTVPAVIFSTSGKTGNYYHDFMEVLVPLFQTAYQFHGQVQFLVTDLRPEWIKKYELFIRKLSDYDIIDYNGDDRVHCFRRAIVGLISDGREFQIDPSTTPNGYSMVDFTRFMRSAYSLDRDRPLVLGERSAGRTKPRLLIIARSKHRRFVNLPEVVGAAEAVGFEVVASEAGEDVANFSRVVNSCDVMVGVHGAGLTNMAFLPTHAVLIQVVPWGKLDWLVQTCFREPSKGMQLRYMEYEIGVEESTLIDLYPRDDPVFTDPESLHKQGWGKMATPFLVQQNVRLDVGRFKPLLERAMQLLHEKVK